MTEKIFYLDPYRMEFDAVVTDIKKMDDYTAVALDQTAFYPGGGGQLHDTGYLNGVRIEKMLETDKLIYHLTRENSSWTIGQPVTGRVDWERRFFSMQSHTAQHLVSGIFERLMHISTLSIHLSEDYFAIEIDRARLSDEEITEVLEAANKAIRERKEVLIHSIPEKDIPNYPIRKFPKGVDPLRVVEICDHDWSACGGTHVKNVSEIQMIAFIGQEKIRKRLRLKFTCGNALWKQFQSQQRLIQSLKTVFTCDEKEIEDRVTVLTETNKKVSRQLRETTLLWIRETLKNAESKGRSGSLIEIPPDLPVDTKKIFNEMKVASVPAIAFQFHSEQKRFQIISGHPRDWKQMFSDFLKSKTIQGGGNPNFFQGKINGNFTKEQFTDILHDSMKENKND